MHRQLIMILTCALLLAACGGNNTPTPAPTAQQNSVPTAATLPTESAPTIAPREYSTDEVQLPLPGTIIPPATEDPSAGKLYDSIALTRTGGNSSEVLNLVLLGNGSLLRNNVSSTVPADQVKQISDMLDQIGFFGLQGIFQAPGTSNDVYSYSLTAERGGSSRTINAQDGFMPPQLSDLLHQLAKLGTTK